jgi:hypothetical protein
MSSPIRREPRHPVQPAPLDYVARAHTLRALALRDAMRRLFGRKVGG